MQPQTSWTHKFSTAYKDLGELYRFLDWEMPAGAEAAHAAFPLFIPQRLATKIKSQGWNGVLAREFLPHSLEVDPHLNGQGLADPIGDGAYNKAPQLIHRYASRALFTPTMVCPVHCRYCFRRNELIPGTEFFGANFKETLRYLEGHPEISELIFTGGDPFTLSNDKLESYLDAFSRIPSLRDIRFHTRYAVILPERIDGGLIEVLTRASAKFRTVSVAIHANHADEFDEVNEDAIRRLARAPLQLLSQSVLLRGVNDSAGALKDLMETFLRLKVRPYYLHHPDQVKGGMHFYLSLEEGRRIYGSLRRELPGWAIPQYVIDVPGGHGKVPAFNPETSNFSGQLLTQHGETVPSQEPGFLLGF